MMTALEIILVLCGIACVVVSFLMSGKEDNDKVISTELTDKQKQDIREQIEKIVSNEVENVSDKTESQLDKISNTKILEMNEYAETILGEINRNHNETVFLYDMLNEKAKEVKSTVKDVNITKRQVEKIQAQVADQTVEEAMDGVLDFVTIERENVHDSNTSKGVAKNRVSHIVRKNADEETKEKYKHAIEDAKNNGQYEKVVSGTFSYDMSKTQAAEVQRSSNAVKTADNSIVNHVSNVVDNAKTENVVKTEEVVVKEKKEVLSEDTSKDETKSEPKKKTTTRKTTTDSSTVEKEVKKTTTKKNVAKSTENSEKSVEETPVVNIQFEKGANKNEKVLKMYSEGKNNKEIAKELNLGIGEVKLVIDLYNSGK